MKNDPMENLFKSILTQMGVDDPDKFISDLEKDQKEQAEFIKSLDGAVIEYSDGTKETLHTKPTKRKKRK